MERKEKGTVVVGEKRKREGSGGRVGEKERVMGVRIREEREMQIESKIVR